MQAIERLAGNRSGRGRTGLAEATLTISSRNYSSWSLRGWLLAKMSGLDFDVEIAPLDDPATRAELLLLSPSMLVPCLRHDGLTIWNNLAIGEYLHEIRPAAAILPVDSERRARCRSISGEMHAGFAPMRSALPMNIKGSFPHYPRVVARAGRHRPHHGNLARVPGIVRRPVPARRAPLDGGRDVRPPSPRAFAPTTCRSTR